MRTGGQQEKAMRERRWDVCVYGIHVGKGLHALRVLRKNQNSTNIIPLDFRGLRGYYIADTEKRYSCISQLRWVELSSTYTTRRQAGRSTA